MSRSTTHPATKASGSTLVSESWRACEPASSSGSLVLKHPRRSSMPAAVQAGMPAGSLRRGTRFSCSTLYRSTSRWPCALRGRSERLHSLAQRSGTPATCRSRVSSSTAFCCLARCTTLRVGEDRLQALREASRVLKPGGVLLAAAICRFASAFDGLNRGLLDDAAFVDIVRQDLENGQHANPTANPEYFMDTFFHHPEELEGEIAESGFAVDAVCAVEGPSWLARDFDRWWEDTRRRQLLLELSRSLAFEPCVLGASPHIMGVGHKRAAR